MSTLAFHLNKSSSVISQLIFVSWRDLVLLVVLCVMGSPVFWWCVTLPTALIRITAEFSIPCGFSLSFQVMSGNKSPTFILHVLMLVSSQLPCSYAVIYEHTHHCLLSQLWRWKQKVKGKGESKNCGCYTVGVSQCCYCDPANSFSRSFCWPLMISDF